MWTYCRHMQIYKTKAAIATALIYTTVYGFLWPESCSCTQHLVQSSWEVINWAFLIEITIFSTSACIFKSMRSLVQFQSGNALCVSHFISPISLFDWLVHLVTTSPPSSLLSTCLSSFLLSVGKHKQPVSVCPLLFKAESKKNKQEDILNKHLWGECW